MASNRGGAAPTIESMTTTAVPVSRRLWLIPAGLVALTLVPIVAGAFRLTQLAGGAEVTEANARFFAVPLPVVLHIIGATVFSVMGAFQFHPGIRRNHPGYHRAAGRLVLLCGLTAALSGVWMALLYDLPEHDRGLLAVTRVLFGSAMAAALVLAFLAARRRDFSAHRAWMMRGYAIGVAAGTQVFTLGPLLVLFEAPGPVARTVGHAAGWLINLAVAEYLIRRKAR